MMKPTANYRMSKAGKINLAVNWSRANKNARRRSIIESELYGNQVVKGRRDKDN